MGGAAPTVLRALVPLPGRAGDHGVAGPRARGSDSGDLAATGIVGPAGAVRPAPRDAAPVAAPLAATGTTGPHARGGRPRWRRRAPGPGPPGPKVGARNRGPGLGTAG